MIDGDKSSVDECEEERGWEYDSGYSVKRGVWSEVVQVRNKEDREETPQQRQRNNHTQRRECSPIRK